MYKNEIEYFDEKHRLEATMYSIDPSQKKGAVILIHAWQGKNEEVCKRAEEVAKMGYHAYAIDVYGKGILGKTSEECEKLMNPFIEDRKKLKKRLLAAVHFVKNQHQVDSRKIAVMGFCFGGLCALDIARSGEKINGAVSFHGLLHPPKIPQASQIDCSILALHGDLDPLVSKDQIEDFKKEMSEKKANWEFIIYGNTHHAFTNPHAQDESSGLLYNKCAEKRSFERLESFLHEILN